MTFTHPRSSWVPPAPPITGPAIDWTRITDIAIHYTADDDLIDGDPGEFVDRLDDYLRGMQSSYVRTRGYSVGYNAAVDWLGGSWELRGWDIRCAANRPTNDRTWAILVLVDGNDMATTHAAATIRTLVAEAERRARRELRITGHGQLPGAATACPGSGLRAQIALGEFSPRWRPAPPPEVVPPPIVPPVAPTEDDPMFYLTSPTPGQRPDLIWFAGRIFGISSPADAQQFLDAGAKRLNLSADQFDHIVATSPKG